jgi:DNA-binding MarR family transcriptional regulator
VDDFTVAARKIAKECAGLRARQVSRMLTRVYDDALRPLGLQMPQLSLLVATAMFGENGATIGDLAKALVMDRTTLSRNLGPLERAGYLRVARSAGDARVRVVLLSPAGERALVAALPLWETAQTRIRDVLGVQKTAALRDQLSSAIARAAELDEVAGSLDSDGE